jgi:hypothetical protein
MQAGNRNQNHHGKHVVYVPQVLKIYNQVLVHDTSSHPHTKGLPWARPRCQLLVTTSWRTPNPSGRHLTCHEPALWDPAYVLTTTHFERVRQEKCMLMGGFIFEGQMGILLAAHGHEHARERPLKKTSLGRSPQRLVIIICIYICICIFNLVSCSLF